MVLLIPLPRKVSMTSLLLLSRHDSSIKKGETSHGLCLIPLEKRRSVVIVTPIPPLEERMEGSKVGKCPWSLPF